MRTASPLNCLRQHVRNLWNAEDGNVAIILTIALIPVFVSMGAAVDYSRATSVKTAMQAALDAAALKLVRDAGSLTGDQMRSAANDLFAANFNRPDAANVHVTAQFDSASAMLRLRGSTSVDTDFMRVVGLNTMDIGALSVAQGTHELTDCVIALDPAAKAAFKTSGSGTVSVPNCGIYVDSSDGTALDTQGSGHIRAKSIKVVGGAGSGKYSPNPETNQPVLADPLAYIPEPTMPQGCTYLNYTFSAPVRVPGGSVYCGATTIDGNVSFGDGIHYFKGATVTVTSAANVTGNNVMLYFDDTSTLASASTGIFSLKAPSTGTYRGIAIFGSREGSMSTFKLTGSKDYFVDGTIYLPTVRLELYGTADLSATAKSGYVIAKQFYYQGDSSFSFAAFGGTVPSSLLVTGAVLVQ